MLVHMTFKDKDAFQRHHVLSIASWARANPDYALLLYDDGDLSRYLSFDADTLALYNRCVRVVVGVCCVCVLYCTQCPPPAMLMLLLTAAEQTHQHKNNIKPGDARRARRPVALQRHVPPRRRVHRQRHALRAPRAGRGHVCAVCAALRCAALRCVSDSNPPPPPGLSKNNHAHTHNTQRSGTARATTTPTCCSASRTSSAETL